MSEKHTSDLAQTINELLEYARDKGQIYSAWDYSILYHMPILASYKCRKLGIKEEICRKYFSLFSELSQLALKTSVHEVSIYNTVWQKALDIVTKINSQTNIITEMKKQKKIE